MATAAVRAAEDAAGTGFYDGDGYYITFQIEEARAAVGASISAALDEPAKQGEGGK